MSFVSKSVRPIGGMLLFGFIAGGSWMYFTTFSGVFCTVPKLIVGCAATRHERDPGERGKSAQRRRMLTQRRGTAEFARPVPVSGTAAHRRLLGCGVDGAFRARWMGACSTHHRPRRYFSVRGASRFLI